MRGFLTMSIVVAFRHQFRLSVSITSGCKLEMKKQKNLMLTYLFGFIFKEFCDEFFSHSTDSYSVRKPFYLDL